MFAKTEVRQRIKQAVKAMSAHERQELSLQLMQKLAQHPRFVQAKVIMLYHALPDEPDTRTLLNTWFKEKHYYCLWSVANNCCSRSIKAHNMCKRALMA